MMRKSHGGNICRLFLVLFGCMLFVVSAQAETIDETSSNRLQTLLIIGLAENLGLQAVKIDSLLSAEEMIAQDARFDPELFAESFHAESRAPMTDSLASGVVHNAQTRAEVGVKKKFSSGLTSSLSLATERVKGDYEYLDPRYTNYLLLNLQQPLLRGYGKENNIIDLRISQNQQQQTQFLYLKQAQDLGLQIEVVYYDLIKTRLTELLRQDSRQLVVDLLVANRAKLDAGILPVSEVQEAETALANRDLQLALARQTREQVTHQLNGLISNRIANPLELSAQVEDISLETPTKTPEFKEVYSKALDNRADLKALIVGLNSRALSRNYLENQTKPNLDLVASAGLSGYSGPEREGNASVRYSGDYLDSYDSLAKGDGYQWSAGVAFSYPLGNREAKARVSQARLEERQAGYRKQELELAIETELRQRLTEMKRTGDRFEIAERLQSLANTTLNQENYRLTEGLSNTFRILTFQGVLIDARIDRLSALIDYNKSLARFNQALGTNLERHGITARVEQEEIRFENM